MGSAGERDTSSTICSSPSAWPRKLRHNPCNFCALGTPTMATVIWPSSLAKHARLGALHFPSKAAAGPGQPLSQSSVPGSFLVWHRHFPGEGARGAAVLTARRALAVGGGNPEAGGTGVKKHQEVLRRGPDADLPKVGGLRARDGAAALATGAAALATGAAALATGAAQTRLSHPSSVPASPVLGNARIALAHNEVDRNGANSHLAFSPKRCNIKYFSFLCLFLHIEKHHV